MVINNTSVAGMWVVTNAITMIVKDVEVENITWYRLVTVIVIGITWLSWWKVYIEPVHLAIWS